MGNDLSEFYANLQDIAETTFPKNCATCGAVYHDSSDFLLKTQSLSKGGSGLKGSWDDDDKPIVELYRNCVCGSTLMNFFSDRRDNSEKGAQRRLAFERLLVQLETKGIERVAGRVELKKLLKGEVSDLLKSYGFMPFVNNHSNNQEL